MVVGSGKDGVGKVLLYKSENLLNWEYIGVLYENRDYGKVFECPDFFKIGEDFVLMFSKMVPDMNKTQFIIGDFDGEKFYPKYFQAPENGPQFYAPQTFCDGNGRRILIAWFYNWEKKPEPRLDFAGAFTIPREVKIYDGKIHLFPVDRARRLLKSEDKSVKICKDTVIMRGARPFNKFCFKGEIKSVHILRDEKAVEVFINDGETSYSYWL